MRQCFNDKPEVYEATGENLGDVLREVADLVDTHEGYVGLQSHLNEEGGYLVVAYLH
jgi:hypothetical protein